MFGKKTFQGILPTSSESLTTCKISVFHYVALQFEALVTLLQETHCTNAGKLVLSSYQLAGPPLTWKHGLATFVLERLRYTLLDPSFPALEIEYLCMNVDGYKIVSVYQPSPTRLRSFDLPVFLYPCRYPGDFNCLHSDWSYDDNSLDVNAWLAGKVLPSYTIPEMPPAFTPAAGTLTLIQI